MRIAIIGAGWFGCHLASVLLKHGHEITIFERNSEIFLEASGFNQYRVHHGFHYPRSSLTRRQVVNSLPGFMSAYGKFTHAIDHNLYAVARADSYVDFGNFTQTMGAEQLKFTHVDAREHGMTNIEGVVNTEERFLDTPAVTRHFAAKLAAHLRLKTPVTQVSSSANFATVNGEKFDFVMDCTYNQREKIPGIDVFYEADITLVYKTQRSSNFALTVVDGPFSSLCPMGQAPGLYTLTSVTHTPVGCFQKAHDAWAALRALRPAEIERARRPRFEEGICEYLPRFKNDFSYQSFFTSMKTKFHSAAASRECIVHQDNRVVTLFSGKISNIIFAEQEALKIIGKVAGNEGDRNDLAA